MKRRLHIAGLALGVAALIVGGAQAGVEWNTNSYDDIMAKAKAENKHVVVDFFTLWCGPCKLLDKETYTDPEVAEFLNSQIPVKWNSEKGEGEDVSAKYNVWAWPTLMVIAPDGKEVGRFIGFLPPEKFIATMQGFIEGKGTVGHLQRLVEADPDNIELLNELGVRLADAVRTDEARKVVDRMLALDPNNEQGYTVSALYALGEATYAAKENEESLKRFQRIVEKYPDSEEYDASLQRMAALQHRLGDSDKAVETFMRYVERHPDNPKSLNSFAWFCAARGIGYEKALPVALRAVELSGRDPGILDTLAELYYSAGEFDKAIEIGKEALASDPGDEYFQEQIAKFEKAKAEGKAQARK